MNKYKNYNKVNLFLQQKVIKPLERKILLMNPMGESPMQLQEVLKKWQ